jgi:type II secretory pathway pseudopilin PulG
MVLTRHRDRRRDFCHLARLRLPRGIAIVTVLITVLLVVVLLTAAFQSQFSRSSLARYESDRQIASEAAHSVLEFARYKLEQDQTWLGDESSEFLSPPTPDGEPLLTLESLERVEREEEDMTSFTVTLAGTIHTEQDIDFTLTLTNNLPNDAAEAGLAPHSCSLEVATRFGIGKVRQIWLLRHAPFSHATVAASGDIEIATEQVVFSSTDSSRNQIRSLSSIFLPQVENLEFKPDGGWQRQEKGTVWAHDEIRVGPEDSPTPLEVASEETGAQFIPNGRSAYRVPKLQVADVGADPEKEAISLIPAGQYTAGTVRLQVHDLSGNIHERELPVVERRAEDEPSSLYFVESNLQAELPPLDLSTVRFASDPERTINPVPTATATVNLGGPLKANLLADQPCQLTLPAEKKIVCEGTLSITGFDSAQLPVLEFVSPKTSPDEVLPKGYLECKDGELSVACDLKNAGMLMASGDVNIYPADVELEASLAADLAIFAGGDVNIDPRLVASSPARVEESGRKLAFRGLIYAAGSVVFDTVSSHTTSTGNPIYFNREVEVEGAVVARGGSVNITGEYGAELRYNPDFLDDVMESSLSSPNRQLEIVSAREL